MSDQEFSWSSGVRFATKNGVSLNARIDPKRANDAIVKVQRKQGGKCQPADIVNAARSNRNPLHKCFEWDDAVAGDKYREDQARMILRGVQVRYTPSTQSEPMVIRAQSKVESDARGNGYKLTADAIHNAEDLDYMLQTALNQLVSWRRRWSQLNELKQIVSAMDGIDSAIGQFREVIAAEE